MKFTLGFIAGLGAAWAALAIWQKIPTLGEFVWEGDPEPDLPEFEPIPVTFEQDSARLRDLMMRGDCTGFGGGSVINSVGAP